MIRLRRLTAGYGSRREPVFSGLCAEFEDSGIYALTGASGVGKTTLLHVLCGLIAPLSGSVEGLEGRRVILQFQDNRLLPWRSVLDNVMLGMPRPDQSEAQALLRRLELDCPDSLPSKLSGGMQRRVSLARALAFGADVLLLDEPFTGMDEALKGRIAPHILSVRGLTLFSTHDPAEAVLMGARTVRFDDLTGAAGPILPQEGSAACCAR